MCASCGLIGIKMGGDFAGPTGPSATRRQAPRRGEALAEGIVTGHPSHAQIELTPDQIHDLLSLLETLE